MSAIDTLRKNKRNGETPASPLESLVLNEWYVESHNGTQPAPRAEAAAKELENLQTTIGKLSMAIHVRDEQLAALKEQK